MPYSLNPLLILTFPNIDPIIFQAGPFAMRWYGLAYVAGILLAWLYCRKLAQTPKLWAHNEPALTTKDLDDFIVWAVIGVILGGRIGYVLFYHVSWLWNEPLSIFAITNGGMSFHGGVIGTTIAMIVFARSRNIPMWSMIDTIAAGAPIGLMLGRIANFINSELWGRPTSAAWSFIFPTDPLKLPRHPSQLYESALEGIVLFGVLWFLIFFKAKLKRPKFICGAFVAGYGFARIIVEFFREPDDHLGYLSGDWLTMGMILSLPMIIAGIWAMTTAKQIETVSKQS